MDNWRGSGIMIMLVINQDLIKIKLTSGISLLVLCVSLGDCKTWLDYPCRSKCWGPHRIHPSNP